MIFNKQYFCIFIILVLFIINVQCQNSTNKEGTKTEEVVPNNKNSSAQIKSTQSDNTNSSSNNNISNRQIHNNTSNNKNEMVPNTETNNAINSAASNNSASNLPENNQNNDSVNTQTNSNNLERIEKAKAERIEGLEISNEELGLIKWNEFDKPGFSVAVSTPKEFDENSIVDIKWQALDNMVPSSTIKIELHTNLTRKNDYMAYPTTETIVIDDNIPSNVNEINWNPYLKLKKNEKYYIRVWAYTNKNTATMSGLCFWAINDLISENKIEEPTKHSNTVKLIAYPTIGALLCFTVVGHFMYENKRAKKYKSVEDDSSETDSRDGLINANNISYDTIRSEGNLSYNTLPQPWELEAKRKHMKNNRQHNLSDENINMKRGIKDKNYNIVNLNDRYNNGAISITVEKPQNSKFQKIPKYPPGY